MRANELGRLYQDGEVIVRKGDGGSEMFIVQKGELGVFVKEGGEMVRSMGSGDIFGEMSLFTHEPRSATVVAQGEARVLTVDERTFRRRIKVDPMLAYRLFNKLTERLRTLDPESRFG